MFAIECKSHSPILSWVDQASDQFEYVEILLGYSIVMSYKWIIVFGAYSVIVNLLLVALLIPNGVTLNNSVFSQEHLYSVAHYAISGSS